MVAWTAVRPSPVAEFPGTSLLTMGIGIAVARMAAPKLSIVKAGLGLICLCFGAGVLLLARVYNIVDDSVHISQEDHEKILGDMQRLAVTEQERKTVEMLSSGGVMLAAKGSWGVITAALNDKVLTAQSGPKKGDTAISRASLEMLVEELLETEDEENISEESRSEDYQGDNYAEIDPALAAETMLQVFSLADVDNDGILTFAEYYRALLLIFMSNTEHSSFKTELWYETMDIDHDGAIDRGELLHFIKRLQVNRPQSTKRRCFDVGLRVDTFCVRRRSGGFHKKTFSRIPAALL